jgi:hypothetical protein
MAEDYGIDINITTQVKYAVAQIQELKKTSRVSESQQ